LKMIQALRIIGFVALIANLFIATPSNVYAADGSRFAAVDVGMNHTCALTTAGRAYCWGDDSSGQLGDGPGSDGGVNPRAVIGGHRFRLIDAGYYSTCAITKSKGALYCWGFNDYGQLGIGTHDDDELGNADIEAPARVAGYGWSQVSVGSNTTCGIRKLKTYCWGYNEWGSVGNGDHDGTEAGLANVDVPTLVLGEHRFMTVSVGDNTTCAVTFGGDGYCWGTGNNGELGNGDFALEDDGQGTDADSDIPVSVSGGHRFVDIQTGSESSCGLDQRGRVWCWGETTYGQIGDGSGGPAGFVAVPTRVNASARFVALSGSEAMAYSTCGLKATGVAFCWGWNGDGYGVLGIDSDLAQENFPVQVPGKLRFVSIDIDDYHACGLTTRQRVYCWGLGESGQLGIPVSATKKPTEPVVIP
jgi:alpha-tubulin suppressor-like RCC1 family protein